MRLSYSSVSTYQNCPLSYKLRYVDRLPTKKTPQLSYGSSLHSILAYFYDTLHKKPLALDKLIEHFPGFWESEGYQDPSEEKTYFEHAIEVLTQFYHTNIDKFQPPVALEHKFGIELDYCTLTGIIDRVDRLPSGSFEVIDYKTNRKLPPKSKIHSDLQLSIYHLACQEVWGIEPEKLTLYFLIPNTKISTNRTDEEIKRTKSLIARTCDDIQTGKFQPRQNPLCPWCDFQPYCPYHKHKFEDQNTSILAKNALEIESVINEFIAIKESAKELGTRLNELNEIIHAYCNERDTVCLSSENGEIVRNKRITQGYNVDKLREILNPLGLWEQIITVDSTMLKQLIGSSDVSDELRRQIQSAVETEETSYTLHIKRGNSTDENKKSGTGKGDN